MADRENRVPIYADEELDLYAIYGVLRKRIWLIFGLLVVGISVAVTAGFLSPPVFQSKFTIKLFSMSPAETKVLLDNLKVSIKETNFNLLSRKLGIKKEAAEKIVAINAGGRVNSGKKNFLQVTLEVYDPSILPALADSLVQWLNRNNLVKKQLSLQKRNLLYMRNEIVGKLNAVEELGDIVSQQIKQGHLSNIGFNPINVETDIIKLKQKLQNLEDEIALTTGFEISIEPTVPRNPIRPKKVMYIAVAGFVALFVGIFLAFFKEWLDKNKEARSL